MKDLKALSSNLHPEVGRKSIHNVGSINTALLGIDSACTCHAIAILPILPSDDLSVHAIW